MREQFAMERENWEVERTTLMGDINRLQRDGDTMSLSSHAPQDINANIQRVTIYFTILSFLYAKLTWKISFETWKTLKMIPETLWQPCLLQAEKLDHRKPCNEAEIFTNVCVVGEVHPW